jgi:hypothetical protein
MSLFKKNQWTPDFRKDNDACLRYRSHIAIYHFAGENVHITSFADSISPQEA